MVQLLMDIINITLVLVVLLCSGCHGARIRREMPEVADGETVKQMVKFQNDQVTMTCGLGGENGLLWYDKVHNMADAPQLIFDSRNLPNRAVDPSHMLKDQIKVNDDNSITITGLTSTQAGQYFCQAGPDGAREWVELIIAETPECSGKTETFYDGGTEEEKYECAATVVGNARPLVQILVGEEVLKSEDLTFISKTKHEAMLIPAAKHDGKKARCRITIADVVEECVIGTFVVKYGTKNLTASEEPHLAGSDYTCMAKGNPTPHITMTTSDGDKVMGDGSVSHKIKDEWTGKDGVWIHCHGHNEYMDANGAKVTGHKEMNTTITVDAPPTLPPTEKPLESGKPEEEKPKPGAGTSGAGDDKEVTTGGTDMQTIIIVIVVSAVVLVIVIMIIVIIKRRKAAAKRKGAKRVPTSSKEADLRDNGKV